MTRAGSTCTETGIPRTRSSDRLGQHHVVEVDLGLGDRQECASSAEASDEQVVDEHRQPVDLRRGPARDEPALSSARSSASRSSRTHGGERAAQLVPGIRDEGPA